MMFSTANDDKPSLFTKAELDQIFKPELGKRLVQEKNEKDQKDQSQFESSYKNT